MGDSEPSSPKTQDPAAPKSTGCEDAPACLGVSLILFSSDTGLHVLNLIFPAWASEMRVQANRRARVVVEVLLPRRGPLRGIGSRCSESPET